ncbi:hypothetical protein ESA_00302 [Cronobacter sakazakii ATCC BAA-894]|uniref:Uncharacterized protein n=1 Tax=Cronobacter sakazakii (strain ATCC BAA-894) TaxID=290339 RepID=A7MM00_CROS8|nr:hypothetical protein ESA_00302 [Cronobacter sakazakii ATCC BAA-894]
MPGFFAERLTENGHSTKKNTFWQPDRMRFGPLHGKRRWAVACAMIFSKF